MANIANESGYAFISSEEGFRADNPLKRVTLASLAGTMMEYYDNFIYGTASAIVFPKVFFSQVSPSVALMLSLGTYGIAYAARPLGALIFGHFGDRIGRKNMLVAALFIMGVATFLIGCLPGQDSAGVLGACLLCVLRLMQGIALGGEWGGAALMVNEFARDSKYKGLLGSVVQISAPAGFLLASGIFSVLTSLLSESEFFAWGWRIPFFLSAILVIGGLYLRSQIDESPVFLENIRKVPHDRSAPIVRTIRHHWRALLLAIGTRIGSDIAFYVFALFPLVYLPSIGVSKHVALQASIAASIGQMVGIPLFGILCDRFSTRLVLSWGAVGNLLWAFVYFVLIDTQVTGVILLSAFIALFLLAALWAPLAAHLPAMFPVEVRFTGAGLGFQTAGVLGGALAPSICLALLSRYGGSLPVSFYLGATLLLAFCCVRMTRSIPRQ